MCRNFMHIVHVHKIFANPSLDSVRIVCMHPHTHVKYHD